MKLRIVSFFLAAALLLMTACSGSPSESSSGGESSAAPQSSEGTSQSPDSSSDSSEDESSQSQASQAESSASKNESASSTPQSGSDGEIPYALPESTRAADSYFDDAVFIGDSVSLKLERYTTQQRSSNPGFFGKAQFLTAGSMGSGNALEAPSSDSIHPLYNGQKMALADAVKASGAKKVYIMLGMNDMAVYGVDGAVSNMETLIEGILEKTPDAQIFVESATPLVASKNISSHKLNNTNLFSYNQKLSALCKEKGWYFVNVWSTVDDGTGNLKTSYCSDPDDMGIHFTDAGCEAWIEYLYTHTA
ncbi:MAG: GDSL-type esterase/lipase family protein [Hydrogeniiclostridium sp.]